ncbi:MAG: hypothetical protein C4551_02150 [Bacillota bacterium]|nr:MAG: hypothetical protein C4551_02150 [Bacillota bacterium]
MSVHPLTERASLRPKPVAARFLAPAVSVIVVVVFVAVAYRELLLADPATAYPTGWDSWGHLFKAQYLADEISQGRVYPALLPWWYDGLELFRYWSPLPIYVLAALGRVAGSVFGAGAWFIPLAAAFGGLSWLLYSGRLGWLGATAAALAWTVWPDHVWVAVADGNLPRVLSTALLPLILLTFLDSLELRRWPWSGLGFLLALQLVILCHAMIGAMVCLAMAGFCLVYWFMSGVSYRAVVRGAALLVLAVLGSSWWLVPSLTGGIVSIPASAIREAILGQAGIFQLVEPRALAAGGMTVLLLVLVLATWRGRAPLSKTLWVCGLVGFIITVPALLPLYMALPLSHLIWPSRFASLVPLALLASLACPREGELGALGGGRSYVGVAAVIIALAPVSVFATQGMVEVGERDPEILAVSRELSSRASGWRVALFDLSHLTSQAAYDLTDEGGREQVYGFAYQGAALGPQLVLINSALEHGDFAYAVDRAWQCGATDIVIGARWLAANDLMEAATAQGYDDPARFGTLTLVSRPARPQAYVSPYRVAAIGRLAGIISMMFPEVETGRADITSYTSEELAQYETIFLTGVEWDSRDSAEELVRDYLRGGGRVIVDLTRFPSDTLSNRPDFLGVVGERISLTEMPAMEAADRSVVFAPLSKEFDPWVALTPQGLDRIDISFLCFGQTAAVLGSRAVEGRDVQFVGINLPYHAYLTRDPEAIGLFADLLGVEPGAVPDRQALPLGGYRAGSSGYSFSLVVPEAAAGRKIVLPFAAMDSLVVRVDGVEVAASSVEKLVAITAGPGLHLIRLEAGPAPTAGISAIVSALTGLLVLGYAVTRRGSVRHRRKEASLPR